MIWLRRVALTIIAGIILYMGAAIVGAVVPGKTAQIAGGDAVEIALFRGPIHYDILLPADAETRAAFGFAADVPVNASEAAWIVVGWGSRAFYTATGTYQDVQVATIWDAANGDDAVLRIDVAGDLQDHPDIKRVPMSRAQFAALRSAIIADVTGPALNHPGLTPTDRFFPARGHFSVLRTCNVWVSQMLRKAGIRFGIWTPTPYAVTLSHWWFS